MIPNGSFSTIIVLVPNNSFRIIRHMLLKCKLGVLVEYLKFRLSAQDNLGIGYGAFSSKLGTEFDIWRGVHTIVHSVDFVCSIEFDTFGTELSKFRTEHSR